MDRRLPTPRNSLLTTLAFLFAVAGASCLSGDHKPGGSSDGTGGDPDPGDTGGKSGGYVSPDAGKEATGGASATGGKMGGTGGADATGGADGTGGKMGTGGATGKQDAGGAGGAGDAPTFTMVYDQVLAMMPTVPASSCWGPCHAGPGTVKAMAKFDATTKEKAYPGIMKLVVPGNATKSNLYIQISTGKMPEKKPKLPANLIKLVADWINAGAMNN